MDRLYGFYRAMVIVAQDPDKFGRVKVYIPDLMPDLEPSEKNSLWANPANNMVGGRNDEYGYTEHHYMGTSFIPQKGSWVFIFFEAGNINRPFYFGALDLENTKVLPENQLGSEYEKKWTVLKTHEGRCIVMSDDADDARVEFTGKKRSLAEPPTGDTASVYTIDGNQTTILFDERSGKEKILIRTHKGDFFHIDVDEQKLQAYFKSDIQIKSDANIKITAKDNIDILTSAGEMNLQAKNDFNLKAMNIKGSARMDANISGGVNTNLKAGANLNAKAAANTNIEAAVIINIKGGTNIMADAAMKLDQCGAAGPATDATEASDAVAATPEGGRDT